MKEKEHLTPGAAVFVLTVITDQNCEPKEITEQSLIHALWNTIRCTACHQAVLDAKDLQEIITDLRLDQIVDYLKSRLARHHVAS